MITKGGKWQTAEQKKSDITTVLYLLREPRTIDQICRLFYGRRFFSDSEKKYVKNVLQKIKTGSHEIVRSEKRHWRIDKNYVSGMDELAATVFTNYGLVWQRSITNQARRAECRVRGTAYKRRIERC